MLTKNCQDFCRTNSFNKRFVKKFYIETLFELSTKGFIEYCPFKGTIYSNFFYPTCWMMLDQHVGLVFPGLHTTCRFRTQTPNLSPTSCFSCYRYFKAQPLAALLSLRGVHFIHHKNKEIFAKAYSEP